MNDPHRDGIIARLNTEKIELGVQNDTLAEELRVVRAAYDRDNSRHDKEMRKWHKWAATAKKMYTVLYDQLRVAEQMRRIYSGADLEEPEPLPPAPDDDPAE